jgi:Leucine-rich repeat (LRR) protein
MPDKKNFKLKKILFYLNLLVFLLTSIFLLANLLNSWEKNFNFSFIWYLLILVAWCAGVYFQGRWVFRRNKIKEDDSIASRDENKAFIVSESPISENNLSKDSSEDLSYYSGDISNSERIVLKSKGLYEIPDYIKDFTGLKQLYLYGNKIKTLPDFICNLKDLELLDLTGNQLTELPETIGNLINLKKLNLSFNKLEKIPDSIGKLKNLQVLNLIHNELASLPNSIGELTNLRELYLMANKINGLPDSIIKLKNLEIIN